MTATLNLPFPSSSGTVYTEPRASLSNPACFISYGPHTMIFFKLFFTKNVQGATQAISYFGLTHAKDHYLSSNSRIRSIYPAFVWLSVKDDFKMRQEQKSGTQGILATCRFLCELCFFIYGVHQSPWSNV